MEIVYLRVGELPIGGKSFNRTTKKHEAGVSVWDAIEFDEEGQYRILMPLLKRDQWEAAGIDFHASYGKPVYLVTGKVLKARGSIGETLMTDVVIVKEVNPCAGRAWRNLLDRPNEEGDEDDTDSIEVEQGENA